MEPQQEYTTKVIEKPIHAKPSLYAYYFELIKAIGKKYGYNIVVHGSMNRDLDLVAIPWNAAMGDKEQMIDEICEALGGTLLMMNTSVDDPKGERFTTTYHGRMQYAVNINRDIAHKYDGTHSEIKDYADPQYYLDISVLPMKHEAVKVEIPSVEQPQAEVIVQSGSSVETVYQLLMSKNLVTKSLSFQRDKIDGRQFKKELVIENILTGIINIHEETDINYEVRATLDFESHLKRNSDRINEIKQYLTIV
ncbi:hypothetical protein [Flectobacillus sp. BAB-3569]|uniref:hypothetical protein n=1 Tax=Flectobacillus sp. BAB-3569 TaxID=1509483 RepID=UPI000BA41962|nr:hypothetical protein [Flectobacillus sp. BAB-3569]PAC27805.1 hypothetical protein BWI92_21575 [Flectobacillus sp. BAB-3569]